MHVEHNMAPYKESKDDLVSFYLGSILGSLGIKHFLEKNKINQQYSRETSIDEAVFCFVKFLDRVVSGRRAPSEAITLPARSRRNPVFESREVSLL